MSKHFYFIDPNGNFASEDGTIRYRLEKGRKGMETVRAMRKEREVRFMEYQEDENRVLVELSPKRLKDYRVRERHEQYIKDLEKESQTVVLSLDNTIEIDGEEVVYHDVVASDYDLEAEVFKREELSLLKKALSALNKEELELIEALFLSDEPLSERDFARKKGIPQRTLNHRKAAILKKLKKFFEKSGSN